MKSYSHSQTDKMGKRLGDCTIFLTNPDIATSGQFLNRQHSYTILWPHFIATVRILKFKFSWFFLTVGGQMELASFIENVPLPTGRKNSKRGMNTWRKWKKKGKWKQKRGERWRQRTGTPRVPQTRLTIVTCHHVVITAVCFFLLLGQRKPVLSQLCL